MSFETDLVKFKKQVDSFVIAGAFGNFHTGFSIGDDTRGAGAGVRTAELNTPEEILTSLENSFKNFTIRGGHDVSVAGSLTAGGFAISAKGGVPQDGVATGPPPPPLCANQIQVVLSDITICPCVNNHDYTFTINDTYILNLDFGDASGCLWSAAFFAVGTVDNNCTGDPDIGDLDTELVVEFNALTGEWFVHYEDQSRSAIFFESVTMDSGDTFNNNNTVCGDPATNFGPPAIQTGTGGAAILTLL